MKSPAFRFYPSDFMGSPDVQAMDLHEVGAYILLLCTAWQSDRHGYLPDDDEKLRRWARMTREQWSQSRELLLGKFPIVEPGLRANPRMVLEAEKQAAFSQSQRDKINSRWEKHRLNQNDTGVIPGYQEQDTGVIPSVSVSVKDKNIPSPAEPLCIVPKKTGKPSQRVVPPFVLDRSIPADAWEDFEQHRTGIKKAMTDNARWQLQKKLLRLQGEGHDVRELIENAIIRKWQDVSYDSKKESPYTSQGVTNPVLAIDKLKRQGYA